MSIRHLHVSTLKPFDDPAVTEAAASAQRGVVTMENHTVIGGVGSAVAEVMAEAGVGTKLLRLGIPDRYAHGASRPYLMRECGLDATALVRGVETLLGERLDVAEEELAAVRLEAVHSAAKAEAL